MSNHKPALKNRYVSQRKVCPSIEPSLSFVNTRFSTGKWVSVKQQWCQLGYTHMMCKPDYWMSGDWGKCFLANVHDRSKIADTLWSRPSMSTFVSSFSQRSTKACLLLHCHLNSALFDRRKADYKEVNLCLQHVIHFSSSIKSTFFSNRADATCISNASRLQISTCKRTTPYS